MLHATRFAREFEKKFMISNDCVTTIKSQSKLRCSKAAKEFAGLKKHVPAGQRHFFLSSSILVGCCAESRPSTHTPQQKRKNRIPHPPDQAHIINLFLSTKHVRSLISPPHRLKKSLKQCFCCPLPHHNNKKKHVVFYTFYAAASPSPPSCMSEVQRVRLSRSSCMMRVESLS